MRLQACIALLLYVSACATSAPGPEDSVDWEPGYANLQRAAALPWTDGGGCVVQEASRPWPVLAERCYHALDHDRVEFHDLTGRCSVASAAAATVGFGLCVFMAPEIAVGAVVVTGVVVAGYLLKEALHTYELRRGRPETRPVTVPRPVPVTKTAPPKPSPGQKSKPDPKGPDFPPVGPTEVAERERRRRCEPIPVPHEGKDAAHDRCADQFPPNRYPGMDVLVDGVSFDALQVGVPVLWEIKTHRFDTYPDYIQNREIEKELEQLHKERDAALACRYRFVVGVSTQAHKDALLAVDPSLIVVVTGCKR
ncbi:DUF6310 domain-containing protein [Archangium primigenium]|uniref:DUF6310 domain-containing protein n=1 Tax=[Archangium] primigenium TaxID=2792470 RepID=UPI001959C975|nr:DUF6310 domain-containing protein [Archangium primigenium]MBM7114803.1 hypothetical protein [Archangium primigenium]